MTRGSPIHDGRESKVGLYASMGAWAGWGRGSRPINAVSLLADLILSRRLKRVVLNSCQI
jgi:hypothetical protein